MKCDNKKYDAMACDEILNACEKLIVENGILSFNHTNVIKTKVCSSRKLYDYFESREEIAICLLLRRTVAYEIEKFLEQNEQIPAIVKLFVPTLMTFEVSRIDPVYQKACLMATNVGVWQVAHESKQSKLKAAEKRYIETIEKVVRLAIESGDLCETSFEHISRDIYLYTMGRLLSLGSIISKTDNLKPIDTHIAESLIGLVEHYMIKKRITSNIILRLNEEITNFLKHDRVISCDRCRCVTQNYKN